MKKIPMPTIILIIFSLFVLPINSLATTWSDRFFDKGRAYQRDGNYLDAAKAFETAIKWELDGKKIRTKNYILFMLFAGKNYLQLGQCDKVIELYDTLLPYVREDDRHLASVLNSLGECHFKQHRVDIAFKLSQEALELSEKNGEAENIAAALANIAQVFQVQGKYSKAFENYQQAINIHKNLGNKNDKKPIEDQLSTFLLDWGLFSESIRVYQQDSTFNSESVISKELSNKALINIGVSFYRTDQFTKGESYLKEALSRASSGNNHEEKARANEHLGTLYSLALVIPKEVIEKTNFNVKGSLYVKAKQHYQASLDIYQSLQRKREVAGLLLNIGIIDLLADNLSKEQKLIQTMSSFQKALSIFKEEGDQQGLARTQHNIGVIYHIRGEYKKALLQFKETIEIFEALRKRIDGIDRWEVAMRQLQTLEFQMTTQLALKDHEGLFNSMEMSKNQRFDAYRFDQDLKRQEELKKKVSKKIDLSSDVKKVELLSTDLPLGIVAKDVLLEPEASSDQGLTDAESEQRLAEAKISELPLLKLDRIEASKLVKKLSGDEAILSFGKTTWEEIAIAVLIKDEVFGTQSSNRPLLEGLQDPIKELNISDNQQQDQGINIVPARRELVQQLHQADPQRLKVEKIFETYIRLLAQSDSQNDDLIRRISRQLYDFLIKPIEEKIADKKRISVMAEGYLNLIPFGSLVDESGKYLAERFEIRYIPAYGMIEMINGRIDKGEKATLLAFGGANYQPVRSRNNRLNREFQLAYLQSNITTDWQNPVPIKNGYTSFGLGPWGQIPGSDVEVNAITDLVEGSHMIAGDDATEKELKEMSRNNELTKYRAIHFDLHGSIIGALPEMSGLIFSDQNQSDSEEDGFLTVGEIERLKLDLDYVNLSATTVAPGRIYGGFGVIQFVQAFLAKGVDSLSMRFWHQGETAKKTYMIAFYEQVYKNGKSFSEASSIVKRKFINGEFGEEYRKPHYWSANLHYGK